MRKDRQEEITLSDVLDLVDYHRESVSQYIEICRPNENWDDVDRVMTSSALLIPFEGLRVKEMAAIEEDVIRVDLDWGPIITQ